MPDQLKLPFYLWTREAVVRLIERKYGITVSQTTAVRYLKAWGSRLTQHSGSSMLQSAYLTLRRISIAACLLPVLAIVACGGGEPTTTGSAPSAQAAPLPIVWDAYALDWSDGTYVFRTASEWYSTWYALPSKFFFDDPQPPHTPPPAVDFASTMVVGVVSGWGTNSCAGLGVLSAREEETRVLVMYSVSDGRSATVACGGVMVRLLNFVLIPRSDKPVVFQRKDG